MQPVLLGRSFAPLRGETGLCTAEMPSNQKKKKEGKKRKENLPCLPRTSVEDKTKAFVLLYKKKLSYLCSAEGFGRTL